MQLYRGEGDHIMQTIDHHSNYYITSFYLAACWGLTLMFYWRRQSGCVASWIHTAEWVLQIE